jgi:protein TonB
MDTAPVSLPVSPLLTTRSLVWRGPVSSGWMVAGSLLVHGALAFALGGLGPSEIASGRNPAPVAVRLVAPRPAPAPPPAPPPVDVVPPPAAAPATPTRAARPAPIEPEASAPAPLAPAPALPSADDIFGEPPPAPAVMAGGAGAGGPAVSAGTGSAPGGVLGGTGTTAGSSGPAAAGDEDDALARRRARLAYKRELERLLRDRRAYPRAALRERLEGRVELALRVGADGRVLGVRVAESSGFALLDAAALEAAHLDRVPAPPLEAALSDRDEIRIPISYVVR